MSSPGRFAIHSVDGSGLECRAIASRLLGCLEPGHVACIGQKDEAGA
jgi:hypothetical protein